MVLVGGQTDMKKLTYFQDQKAPHDTLKGHRRDIGGRVPAVLMGMKMTTAVSVR